MFKKTKKSLSFIMSLVMVMSMFAGINIGSFAESTEYVPTDVMSADYVLEIIEYKEAEDGSGIIITGASEDISGDITLPSEIDGKKVIAVESFAFCDSENLLSVTLPESIKSIGYAAFDGCTSLISVTAEGCEEIDSYAFEDAQALEYISLSDDIRRVSYGAFEGTKYYNDDSNWEDSALYIGSVLVEYNGNAAEYEIKNGTTVIASNAFYDYGSWTNNTTLESIHIPASVKTIGSSAFADCPALTDIQIEYGVETIEEAAFSYCTALVSIDIPESVTTLEGYVFSGCAALESIKIPASVTTLGSGLFSGCSSLTDIDIHDNITSVGSYIFDDTPYYENEANWEDGALYFGNYLIAVKYNVGNLDVKDGTTCIAGNFIDFDGYEGYWPYTASLYDIEFPDSLISIGSQAFFDCPSLYSVEIPENVQNIGHKAFGYTSLKESDAPVYGFTVYGASGSVAEEYASENGFAFYSDSDSDEPDYPDEPDFTVASVTVEPVSIMEHTNGYWDITYFDGSDTPEFFYYYNFYFNNMTVTLEDGTVITGEDGYIYHEDGYYNLYIEHSQYQNPLTVGINEIPVSIMGYEATAIVEITETFVESIDITPSLTVIENTNGYWDERYDKSEDESEEYFNYYLDFGAFTLTLKDGTVIESTEYGEIEYEGETYWLDGFGQQERYPLSVGVYEIPVSILGYATTVTFEIIETPVAEVVIEPVSLIEHTEGSWQERYNENYEPEKYFEYWLNFDEFTVILKDGTTLETEYGSVEYMGEEYYMQKAYSQYYSPLTVGVHEIPVSVLGYRTTVSLEITECVVSDLIVEPIVIIENTDGNWQTRYNEETGEEEPYFNYWLPFNDFTVVLKDGTELVAERGFVEYNGKDYRIRESSYQSDNPFTVGVNEITVSILGYETTATVEVITTPVESIEFAPISVIENTDGWWTDDYNDVTGEYEHYFMYRFSDISYTVTMKDGTVIPVESGGFEYNDNWILPNSSDSQYENHLSVGENEVEFTILGCSVKVPVTVIESPVESVVVEPVFKRENIDGYLDYYFNEETGTEEECFYYNIYTNDFDYVVTLKDGTTLTSQNGLVDYNGKTYYCESAYADSMLELGTNTIDCRVLGYTVPVTIIVNENPTLGDVNGDGYTTSSDARYTLRAAVGLEDLSETSFINADTAVDGKITAADARIILRVSAMLENGDDFAAVRNRFEYQDRTDETEIYFDIEEYKAGDEFTVTVKTINVTGLKNANVFVTYNTDVLEFVKIENSFTGTESTFAGGEYDNGKISLACFFKEAATEDFEFATITFKALSADQNYLELDIADWDGTGVPFDRRHAFLGEADEPVVDETTTQEPETEVPSTEPTTKEPETEVPTTEPTTKEPETEVPTTEPTTKEPETQAPTTEKPSERPSTDGPAIDGPATDGPATDGPATDGPTEKPVSDKLEVSGNTVKVDNASKVSTVNTKSSANDILKSVKNEKVSIVDKDGKAVSGDALVGTGAKIQIKDNSGKVINTYTVCVPTDVDGNGKTTAADARLALRGSAKLEKVEGVYATASDMNADGKITAADARKILRISAGLEKA